MFEAERQAYLNALGIVQYFPRQPIAGALVSPELSAQAIYPPVADSELVDHADVASQGADASTSHGKLLTEAPQDIPDTQPSGTGSVMEKPATAANALQASAEAFSSEGLKVNIPAELLADSAIPVKQAAIKPKEKASPEVEFCFALIQSPSGMALLVELDDPGVKDMSAREHRLLRDMLLALQIPDESCRFQYFKWPLVNNPRIKQGWPEARETLTAYLEEKLAGAGLSMLLILGEQPARALDIQEGRQAIGSEMLVTAQVPALHQMLADWRHKSRAWRILAPLRGRRV